MQNIKEIEELIKIISKLPGLGPKSAKRIVLKLINDKDKLIKMINKSIEKLPKKCKEIFLLSKRDGFTNQEISEILSISIKTVESQITIAFKQLRKQIL